MQISKKNKWWIIGISIIFVLLIGLFVGSGLWYQSQLKPVNATDKTSKRINIVEGSTANQIGDKLEKEKIIHSALAMSIYLRLNGLGQGFQAGVYAVSPSQTMPEIIDHLTSGKVDEVAIQFYPGAVLRDTTTKPESQKTDVYTVLKKAGFEDEEIEKALKAKYTSPVLKDLPADADLEGYIYGETYFVAANATAEQVLQRAIDQLNEVVVKNDLESKFKKQGLTLHQGIIMASIVQRESVGCSPGQTVCEDQREIASVFYNRLKANMNLGSDVTYHYIADKTGVARNHTLDSPYNTRIHAGLPPGPISAPGESSLSAVGDPAKTDYLYFLSGDDDKTYFATTNTEHESNIIKHCTEKCQLP